ncbi:MAG: sigE 34 [Gemmataceae bacterium]|nr:sigE 34 [Gemmataceae bacterium]
MAETPFQTVHLLDWLSRLRQGDRAARDELLRSCGDRLEQIARRMIRGYPTVRRWADTADVLQNATLRLLRALEQVPVADTRAFYSLATAVIRRELIDLARHFQGPHGIGANHASHHPPDGEHAVPDVAVRDTDPAVLDQWTALHEAAENLPVEEREVFGLIFYHGWPHEQIAELFGVDVRTVRRRWRAACLAIHRALGGVFPGE